MSGPGNDNHGRPAAPRCPCPDLAADDHPVEELISTRIALAGINEATDQLADGKAVRQVIMFDAVDAV